MIGEKGLKEFIVDKASATLAGHPSLGLPVDHFRLNKFDSPANGNYKAICNRLQGMYDLAVDWEDFESRPTSDFEPPFEGISNQNSSGSKKFSREDRESLSLLTFEGAQSRYFSIKNPASETCDWLFESSAFQQWVDRSEMEKHRGILWLKGKPGAGKSVLLKHTLSRIKVTNPKSIFLQFFFNGQGDSLERCLLGMFRSLLHQFLQQHRPSLQDFTATFITKQDRGKVSKTWHQEELRGYLQQILTNQNLPPMFIFIDALDEIQGSEVRDIFAWISELAELAVSKRCNINLCITSRYFPNVRIGKCNQIFVDEKNSGDISKYVQSKLFVEDWLKRKLSKDIIEHSCGVSMWVEIIVGLLNQKHDQGTSLTQMEREIFETQGKMNSVYTQCLEQISDEDRDTTYHLFLWVLFAKRPLGLDELYTALQIDAENPPLALSEIQKSDTYLDKEHQVENLLRRLSKGLIEVTEAAKTRFESFEYLHTVDFFSYVLERPVPQRRVQFIHETVKQFFMSGKGLEAITKRETPEPMGIIHNRFVKTCIGYLRSSEVRNSCEAISNHCRQQYNGSSGSADIEKLLDSLRTYKFFTYSSTYLFAHASDAESQSMDQSYLVNFFSGGRPTCWPFWNLGADWYWARELKMSDFVLRLLISAFSEKASNVDPMRYTLQTVPMALKHVIAAVSISIPLLPMAVGSSTLRLLWSFLSCFWMISALFFTYLGSSTDPFFKSKRKSLLHIAVENNLETCVAKLLENGSDSNEFGGNFGYPICAASYFGYTSILKLLIRHGANVNKALQSRTALLYAAVNNSVDSAHILLGNGACVNGKDHRSRPIQIAKMLNHDEFVKLLLEHEALQDANPAPLARHNRQHPAKSTKPDSNADYVHIFLLRIRNDEMHYESSVEYLWLLTMCCQICLRGMVMSRLLFLIPPFLFHLCMAKYNGLMNRSAPGTCSFLRYFNRTYLILGGVAYLCALAMCEIL